MGVKVAFLSVQGEASKTPQRQFIVPASAVQKIDGRDVVWVVTGSKVERRAVTVALAVGDEVSISAGLSAGENVVVQSSQGLADGAKVVIAEAKP
jgi:multidrug efflux system membrane fusion protein